MNELTILKRRCENECFQFLSENLKDSSPQNLIDFVKRDEIIQSIIEEMIQYVISEMPLRMILYKTMSAYPRRWNEHA